MPLLQLYGGGYINALLQTSFTYYIACIILHWVAPRLLHVESIQVQSRQPGQVRREAFNSLGESPKFVSLSALRRSMKVNRCQVCWPVRRPCGSHVPVPVQGQSL